MCPHIPLLSRHVPTYPSGLVYIAMINIVWCPSGSHRPMQSDQVYWHMLHLSYCTVSKYPHNRMLGIQENRITRCQVSGARAIQCNAFNAMHSMRYIQVLTWPVDRYQAHLCMGGVAMRGVNVAWYIVYPIYQSTRIPCIEMCEHIDTMHRDMWAHWCHASGYVRAHWYHASGYVSTLIHRIVWLTLIKHILSTHLDTWTLGHLDTWTLGHLDT